MPIPGNGRRRAMMNFNKIIQLYRRCIVSHHQHPPVSPTSCPFETPSRPSPKGLAYLVTDTMEGKQAGVDGRKQYSRCRFIAHIADLSALAAYPALRTIL